MDALKSIKSTAKLVLEVLEENEYARKNDFRLYMEVLRKKSIDLDCSLSYFLLTAQYFKAPLFDTIIRYRHSIQKKRPDLIGTEEEIKDLEQDNEK